MTAERALVALGPSDDVKPGPAARLTVDDLEGDTCGVEEAAAVLGIGRTLAYQLARQGELPGVLRLGRQIRVSVRALRAALGAS